MQGEIHRSKGLKVFPDIPKYTEGSRKTGFRERDRWLGSEFRERVLTKTPSTPTTHKLQKAHQFDANAILNKLTTLGYYLGSPDIPAQVEWLAGGRSGDQLVKKQSSSAAECPEEVILTLVGQISMDDFWLLPLGGWTPGNMFKEPITKARARCRLIQPKDEANLQKFHNDWPTYLKNLESFQKLGWASKVQNGMPKQSCIVNDGVTLARYIFEVRFVSHTYDSTNTYNRKNKKTMLSMMKQEIQVLQRVSLYLSYYINSLNKCYRQHRRTFN
jgi:hypothetical protein